MWEDLETKLMMISMIWRVQKCYWHCWKQKFDLSPPWVMSVIHIQYLFPSWVNVIHIQYLFPSWVNTYSGLWVQMVLMSLMVLVVCMHVRRSREVGDISNIRSFFSELLQPFKMLQKWQQDRRPQYVSDLAMYVLCGIAL